MSVSLTCFPAPAPAPPPPPWNNSHHYSGSRSPFSKTAGLRQPRSAHSTSVNPAYHAVNAQTPPSHELATSREVEDFSRHRPSAGMADDEQRRRNYEQSTYNRSYAPGPPARSDTVSGLPDVRGTLGGDGSERQRQSHMLTSRPASSATSATGATGHGDLAGFPYPHSQHYTTQQLPGAGFPYQPVYQPESHQRQQAYPQYAPQVVYGVPQTVPATQPQYESFQTRNTTASADVLSNQYGIQQQYYNPTPSTVSTPQSASAQYSTSQLSAPQAQFNPQGDLARSTLVSPYPAVETGSAQIAAVPTPATAPSTISAEAGGEASQQQQQQLQNQESDRFDFFYSQYKRGLRETNENTSRGRLVEAGESLLEISGWLLGNVENLGLNKDDQALHGERLKLWRDFNYCWLAFLTRQLDDSRQLSATGQSLPSNQNIVSKSTLQTLGDEITRLCDGLEKSGLVDYEMGVWEEEIIDVLLECKKTASDDEAPSTASPSVSRHTSKR